jgi:CBS domain containing-hemolysin-like protein
MSSNHSRFPVIDGDGSLEGIVHAKDLLGVPRGTYGQVKVLDLVHEVLAVPEAAGLAVVLSELRARSTEMAIVIDEYGAPAGVVTLEDIVEELVGDIEDEYDPTAPGDYTELEPGVWIIDALSRTDEIERVTGYDLPEGPYDTVAGLVLDRLERIPEVGEHVIVDGVRIDVLAVEEFAIQQVRVSVAAPDDEVTADYRHGRSTTGSDER